MTLNAGLSQEAEYAGSGISHFVEHMLFKGTPKRKPGQIEEEVKSYGGAINGTTGLDNASYYITVPKEYAAKSLELMEDMVFNPAFKNDEVEKERSVILKEIRMNNDDPTRRVMRNLWQIAYIEHPYKMPVIGYEDLFKDIKIEDLVKYHKARYAPNNMVVSIVGDIDKETMLSSIKSTFGKHKRGDSSMVALPLEPQQISSRVLKDYAQINLGYIAMGYHTVELSDSDLYALDVLGIILGDWDGSRLNKKIVKEKELLYNVSSFNYTPRYPGLFIIYGIGDHKNLEKAKKSILEEIELIAKDGIRKPQLDAAKNMVVSSYISSLETTSGLAQAISQGELLVRDPEFFKKYVDDIKSLDEENIKEVAQKYLKQSNLTVSYLYPASAVIDNLVKLGTVRGKKEEKEPQKVILPNGIRLILKEDHRIPKISIVCAFPGGVRVENKTTNGISNLTSAMLLKGTKKKKESMIASSLESQGGSIHSFSGKNSFGLTLSFLSDRKKDTLDILEDVIKNPVFPEEELKKEKKKIFAAIKAENDDIYSMGFLKLKQALFKNHPYRLREIGETNSLRGITRENIKKFYKEFAVSNSMVMSIVGDFDSESMQKELERRFGNIKKTSHQIDVVKPAPLEGAEELNYNMPREQSLVLFGFRGTTLDKSDRFYLAVLSSILSGENGRLYKSVRNKLGLSYALGAFSAPGIDTGYFAAYVATEQKHIKEIKHIISEELRKVRKGEITDEDLALAKASLIGRQKISLQANKAFAYRMGFDELIGTGFDSYQKYPQRIKDITKEDVAGCAKKYIDLENFVSVTVLGKQNEPRPLEE